MENRSVSAVLYKDAGYLFLQVSAEVFSCVVSTAEKWKSKNENRMIKLRPVLFIRI